MLTFKKVSRIWAIITIAPFLFNSISYGVDTSNYAHLNNTLRPAMKFGKMGLENQELSATRHRRYPTGWNEEALGRLAIDVLAVLAQQLKAGNKELQRENARLKELAFTDKLTRLKNRAYYEEYLPRILDLASEQGFPVSIIMVDADRFKDINDRFGHGAGDDVLKYIASCMADVMRSYDEIVFVSEDREESSVTRLGGEEFIIILPGASLEDAKKVAERVRQRIEPMPDDKGNTHIRVGDRTLIFDRSVTVSLGVASFEKGSKREKAEHSLYQRADFALYVAKEDGRNLVRADDRLRAFMSEAMSLISRDVLGGPVVVNIMQKQWSDLYRHLDKLVRIVNDIWEAEGKNYKVEIIDEGKVLVRVSGSEAEARSGRVLQNSVTAGKCL